MSQRRDTLNVILRDAAVRDVLLRPLSALHLPPTPLEESGLVDRDRLLGIWGRGRQDQLALAREMGIREVPTPGGGCRLTERENARRYWQVLTLTDAPTGADFALANLGRQFWHRTAEAAYWLCVGRNSADNEKLAAAARPGDLLLRLRDLPGPLALARQGRDLALARAGIGRGPRSLLRAQGYGPGRGGGGAPCAGRREGGSANHARPPGGRLG